jgi:hypothetical protein
MEKLISEGITGVTFSGKLSEETIQRLEGMKVPEYNPYEFEYYMKRGFRYYFRNSATKMQVTFLEDTEELRKLKRGAKILLDIE